MPMGRESPIRLLIDSGAWRATEECRMFADAGFARKDNTFAMRETRTRVRNSTESGAQRARLRSRLDPYSCSVYLYTI